MCEGTYLSNSFPQGVFDLAQNVPEQDVALPIGTTANLVVKDDLHPALAYLLRARPRGAQRADPVLGLAGVSRPNDTELPLSPEAARYYKSGPPLLQRYLPYWGQIWSIACSCSCSRRWWC
jgi:hypothetical protein